MMSMTPTRSSPLRLGLTYMRRTRRRYTPLAGNFLPFSLTIWSLSLNSLRSSGSVPDTAHLTLTASLAMLRGSLLLLLLGWSLGGCSAGVDRSRPWNAAAAVDHLHDLVRVRVLDGVRQYVVPVLAPVRRVLVRVEHAHHLGICSLALLDFLQVAQQVHLSTHPRADAVVLALDERDDDLVCRLLLENK